MTAPIMLRLDADGVWERRSGQGNRHNRRTRQALFLVQSPRSGRVVGSALSQLPISLITFIMLSASTAGCHLAVR